MEFLREPVLASCYSSLRRPLLACVREAVCALAEKLIMESLPSENVQNFRAMALHSRRSRDAFLQMLQAEAAPYCRAASPNHFSAATCGVLRFSRAPACMRLSRTRVVGRSSPQTAGTLSCRSRRLVVGHGAERCPHLAIS